MNTPRSYYNQPVRSLQQMLRTVSQHTGDIDRLIPNGIYDPQTQAAVSQFQRSHGLPVTGVADRETWEALVKAYEEALHTVSPAQPIHLDLQLDFPPNSTQYHPLTHLAQCMLHFLAHRTGSILQPTPSGSMDDVTSQALADFQQLCGLPMTGTLDKKTWKHLAQHYSAALVHDQHSR